MSDSFELWVETEIRGRTVGSYNSFEEMVRAHGRSPTSSYLLVPIFCDALGLDPPAYVDFPRQGLSIGWTQVTHRFRDLFQERGIRPHDVLIELPNGTTYICPHVQEYLVHLDLMWESHLTYEVLHTTFFLGSTLLGLSSRWCRDTITTPSRYYHDTITTYHGTIKKLLRRWILLRN